MSEAPRRALKCLSCGAVLWQDGELPEACPACRAPWKEPGVALLQSLGGGSYVLPDGASILKEPKEP